jgi:Pyridine nucleotide-disulphide oxidoreductase
MSKENLPIVVIGGGHSGCEKAKELINIGEHFIVFEMTPYLGGLYAYKYNSKEYLSFCSDPRFHTNSIVQSISPTLELLIETEEELFRLQAREVYLCVGAYEEAVPFPGWTLPGIITKQAAELLFYRDKVNLGENIVYIKNHFDKNDMFLMDLQTVSTVHSIDPLEVDSLVCQGKFGQVNRILKKVKDNQCMIENIDAVICSNRKIPNTELVELAGAKTIPNQSASWVPLLSDTGETTIPNLFVFDFPDR